MANNQNIRVGVDATQADRGLKSLDSSLNKSIKNLEKFETVAKSAFAVMAQRVSAPRNFADVAKSLAAFQSIRISATQARNIGVLADALSKMKAPSRAAIENLPRMARALNQIGTVKIPASSLRSITALGEALSKLKIPTSGAVSRIPALFRSLSRIGEVKVPTTTLRSIKDLSAALITLKVPGNALIGRLPTLFNALGSIKAIAIPPTTLASIRGLAASFSGLKAPSANAISRIPQLFQAINSIGKVTFPATAITAVRQLASAMSSMRAPSAALITRLPQLLNALGNARALPSNIATAMAAIGTAMTQMKAPSAAAIRNLQGIITVLQNANPAQLTAVASALQRLGGFHFVLSSAAAKNLQQMFTGTGTAAAKSMGPIRSFFASITSGARSSTLQMRGLENQFSATYHLSTLLRTAFGGLTLGGMVKGIYDSGNALRQFERTIEAVSTSGEEVGKHFQFISEVTTTMPLDVNSTMKSFSQFAASARLAGVSVSDTQEIFKDFSTAFTVLGRSVEDQSGAWLALEQMMSKGFIQAEELKRQLSQYLPGAMEMMAQAVGVMPGKLMQMMKAGQLSSDNVIKLARLVAQVYGGQLSAAMATGRAQLIMLGNEAQRFGQAIFSSGFDQGLAAMFENIRKALGATDMEGAARRIGRAFANVFAGVGAVVVTFIRNWDKVLAVVKQMSIFALFYTAAAAVKALLSPMTLFVGVMVLASQKLNSNWPIIIGGALIAIGTAGPGILTTAAAVGVLVYNLAKYTGLLLAMKKLGGVMGFGKAAATNAASGAAGGVAGNAIGGAAKTAGGATAAAGGIGLGAAVLGGVIVTGITAMLVGAAYFAAGFFKDEKTWTGYIAQNFKRGAQGVGNLVTGNGFKSDEMLQYEKTGKLPGKAGTAEDDTGLFDQALGAANKFVESFTGDLSASSKKIMDDFNDSFKSITDDTTRIMGEASDSSYVFRARQEIDFNEQKRQGVAEDAAKKLEAITTKAGGTEAAHALKALNQSMDAIKALNDRYNQGYAVGGISNDQAGTLTRAADRRAEPQLKPFENTVRLMNEELAITSKVGNEREAELATLQFKNEMLDKNVELTNEELAAYRELFKLQQEMQKGGQNGVQRWINNMDTLRERMIQTEQDAIGGLSDSITNLLTEGQFSFVQWGHDVLKSVTKNMLDDLMSTALKGGSLDKPLSIFHSLLGIPDQDAKSVQDKAASVAAGADKRFQAGIVDITASNVNITVAGGAALTQTQASALGTAAEARAAQEIADKKANVGMLTTSSGLAGASTTGAERLANVPTSSYVAPQGATDTLEAAAKAQVAAQSAAVNARVTGVPDIVANSTLESALAAKARARAASVNATAGGRIAGAFATSPTSSPFLDLVAGAESAGGAGYNTTLDNGRWTGGPQNLTGMTLDQVAALQKGMLTPENRSLYGNGLGSSALGRYQITGATMQSLRGQMGLKGTELFDPAMQDRMALQLAQQRGNDVGGLRSEWAGLSKVPSAQIEQAYAAQFAPGGSAQAAIANASGGSAATFLQGLSNKGPESVAGMNPVFQGRLAAMLRDAPEGSGIFSGYRSQTYQDKLYENSKNAAGVPSGMVAKVSQHTSGLAADLSYQGQSLANAPPEVQQWFQSNAGSYGLKFPMNNPKGHPYEPWHIENQETRGGAQFSGAIPNGAFGSATSQLTAYAAATRDAGAAASQAATAQAAAAAQAQSGVTGVNSFGAAAQQAGAAAGSAAAPVGAVGTAAAQAGEGAKTAGLNFDSFLGSIGGLANGAISGSPTGILNGVLGLLGGMFKEGGYASAPVAFGSAPVDMFMNAPHYKEGTPNTSGGTPAFLHDNEAVIPLTRGRSIPVEMSGSSRSDKNLDSGSGSVFNLNISGVKDADSFRRSKTQINAQMAAAQQRALKRNG